jgi:acyl-CoA reductase-like NAD-dependent aldehyde dehydrogenase
MHSAKQVTAMSEIAATPRPFETEVLACRRAQQSWARLPVQKRLEPVRRLRRLLVSETDRLCAAVARDVGRPAAEVIGTDILPTADACRFLERHAARVLKPRHVPITRRPLWLWGERDTVYRRPHGVAGIIGTWNYPIYLNGIQIVQALTAGNGVLWKPSELMAESAPVLHGLFSKAGFPPELLQRLPATREAGPQLAEADVDHVVFTGSAAVGRKLAARLGERLVSSTLELSGCDAMFVLEDANIALAAKALWFGANLNRGQTCLAIRRAFVHRTVYPAFVQALEPLAREAAAVPLVLESQVRQAERLVAEAVAAGGRVLDPKAESRNSKAEVSPTVILDARPDMAICREAAFAPICAVLPFDHSDEALVMNGQCSYGLGAAVFSANEQRARRFAARLAVGLVAINDVIMPAAHPATPFGGRGASGWGVTQGEEGLLAMTVPQVVGARSGTFRLHYKPMSEAPHVAESIRGVLEITHGAPRLKWTGLRRVLQQVRRFL